MSNIIKTIVTSSIIILGTSSAAYAGPGKADNAEHIVATSWSTELTVTENFENAVNSVDTYCQAESRKIDRREMSFRNRFENHCKSELLEDYVAKTGSVEIEELYTELKRSQRS